MFFRSADKCFHMFKRVLYVLAELETQGPEVAQR